MTAALARSVARALRLRLAHWRLRAWALRVDLRMRRNGGRFRLRAPRGTEFWSLPRIEATRDGGSGGLLTLALGDDVLLGHGLVLEIWAGGDSLIEIGNATRLKSGVRLQLRNGTIAIGSNVQVRDHVHLKADGVLRIGDHGVLGEGTVIHCTESIEIGPQVGIGERASIVDSDHGADGSDVFYLEQPLRVTPVSIGRNVLISANVTILRGCRLHDNSVVAAGAVLTGGEYPSGWLIAGVPARPLRALGGPAAGA